MSPKTVRAIPFWAVIFLMVFTPFSTMISPSNSLEDSIELSTSGRAQTTWSGTISLTSDYTIAITDELIIAACTQVEMAGDVRIYVDGRITVEGTSSCPVTMSASGSLDHQGIQFNSSSTSRGSKINNLTIEDSMFGITMFGGNPIINNLTIVNPDCVGIDMFNSASPQISDLYIDQAGRNLAWQGHWRYGIGVSVGSGSTPIMNRAIISDVLTRGLNVWGASGGLFKNFTMDNISGSSWSMVAGVWVEDSVPLVQDLIVDKSDNGVVVRHIDDGGYTRGVFKRVDISNSMYRGVYVDKMNHTNYTNYESADFTDLTVTGTGSSGAKTANIGYAAIEVNATGAWFENTVVNDSTTVGVRLYFVDSSTTFKNLEIHNSGDPGEGPHEAGLAIRSSYFAPKFEGLEISNSVGPGISSASGGAMQGSDWYLHNNSDEGLSIRSATLVVNGIVAENNALNGVKVDDARYVHLENVTSRNNGEFGTSDQERAGLYYFKANDIESVSGDVRCRNCDIMDNFGNAIYVESSVDLWLENLNISGNNATIAPIYIDNTGLSFGALGGRFHLSGAQIDTTRAGYALEINGAAGDVSGIEMTGSHQGIYWDGQNNGNFPSSFSDSKLSGSDCLTLKNHLSLSGDNVEVLNTCSGDLTIISSNVNWSNFVDSATNTVLDLQQSTTLHLYKFTADLSIATIDTNSKIEEAYLLDVWVKNNHSNGVPRANVNVTFDHSNPSVSDFTNDRGQLMLEDFIGRIWTTSGASSFVSATVECTYDSTSNSVTVTMNGATYPLCTLPLDNQAPFLIWSTPEDQEIYPSGGVIEFNASESWDLDNDTLTFEWTSSIDGVFSSAPVLIVNDIGSSVTLTDGIHDITLELCDDFGHCVEEIRTIELANQPPTLAVSVTPSLSPWGELIMPRTGTFTLDLNGTEDAEGDVLTCWYEFSWQSSGTATGCPSMFNHTFAVGDGAPEGAFTLTVWAADGINAPVSYEIPVELFNEVPEPVYTIHRTDNYSENLVTIDLSSTVDPEGDNLEIEIHSSLDGPLFWSDNGNMTWQGFLSRGTHTIELFVNDDRPEHVNSTVSVTTLLEVENSLPVNVIATPVTSQTYDSSELIWFSSNGSGDFDAWCGTFPEGGDYHCAPTQPAAGSEFLVVTWESDLDGRLTPEGEDWLIFDERLSAGTHQISLSLDDGIHDPVVTTVTVTVEESAPVLGLASPDVNETYYSSQNLLFDALDSVDYDGDNFTMTIRSDLMAEPILKDVDPHIAHIVSLPAGDHTIEITLSDETGKSRSEFISLTILESNPVINLISPSDRESFEAGADILLQEESYDADDDMTKREWRYWPVGATWPEVLSTQSTYVADLGPGQHDLSLYVEDSRGGSEEEFFTIFVQSSLPELNADSLTMNKETFTAGVKDTLEISVEMSDLDGTTQTVTASIQHGIQSWTFNLSDEDGDGIWQGSVDFVPEDTGRPSLKVYATDGEGDSAYVDVISRSFVVEEGEGDSRGMILIASIGGFIALLAAIAFLMNKRKQKQEELDMIDSWGAFGDGPKEVPQLEGGVSDSAGEVEAAQKAADMAAGEPQNAQPAQAAQEGGSTGGQSLDWDNI